MEVDCDVDHHWDGILSDLIAMKKRVGNEFKECSRNHLVKFSGMVRSKSDLTTTLFSNSRNL